MNKWKNTVALLAIALFTLPVVLFMYAIGSWLLVVYGALFPWQVGDVCVTDTSVKAENVGGFDFEFEEVNCDVIGNHDVQMIFVSRHENVALSRYKETFYPSGHRLRGSDPL